MEKCWCNFCGAEVNGDRCSNCGEPAWRVCPQCGASYVRKARKVPVGTSVPGAPCPSCGARNAPGDSYCLNCGAPIGTGRKEKKASRRTKIVVGSALAVGVVLVLLLVASSGYESYIGPDGLDYGRNDILYNFEYERTTSGIGTDVAYYRVVMQDRHVDSLSLSEISFKLDVDGMIYDAYTHWDTTASAISKGATVRGSVEAWVPEGTDASGGSLSLYKFLWHDYTAARMPSLQVR